jgi:very-short-patch-repair endonuclease
MDFQSAYEIWFQQQLKARKGESRRRLEEGHAAGEKAFLEKVWWPAVGHFEGLSAEYELRDFKDGVRFLDFAYLCGSNKACFEVDGYGPHWRDISRRQFADQWLRQNHLVLDGWKVLRFAYDDVTDRPRHCQQMIQQLLGTASAGRRDGDGARAEFTSLEREILRFIRQQKDAHITAAIVSREFRVSKVTAYRVLKGLLEKNCLISSEPGRQRIHKYGLSR